MVSFVLVDQNVNGKNETTEYMILCQNSSNTVWLSLFQEGQWSVTGESIRYWLRKPAQEQCGYVN